MRQQKMYNLDILSKLKVEINKFKQSHNNETTLDNILIQAKKDIAPLIKAGFSYKAVAIVLKNAGLNIGMHKIKKLCSAPNKKLPTPQINKILTKNSSDIESESDQLTEQANEQEDNQ